MEFYEEKIKARKDLIDYMKMKYGSLYMSAISKLNVPNQFDEKGYLRPELRLTSQEKEALIHYVPETLNFLSEKEEVKSEQPKQQTLDERYSQFLTDVWNSTIKVASALEQANFSEYKIVGLEYEPYNIIYKYGKEVYNKANEEAPYRENWVEGSGFYGNHKREFSEANKKLGYLWYDPDSGVSDPFPLIDIDYLIKIFEEKKIPCYIDFETNTFYYNSVPTKGQTK